MKKQMRKLYSIFIISIMLLAGCMQPSTQSLTQTSTPTKAASLTPTQGLTQTSTPSEAASLTPTQGLTQTSTPSEVASLTPTQSLTQISTPSEVASLTPTQGLTQTSTPTELAELEVHFIDVGQGDSTLIRCKGKTLLIDAGDNNKGTTVQLYLQKQGIERLDYVIGTHTDADHIGGMDVVIYKFDCGTIFLPEITAKTRTYEDVINTIKTKYYKITYPVVGTEYELGDAKFTIIAPLNYGYGNNMNNYSIAIMLEHGENRFLFAGDAEKEAEMDILNSGVRIEADCYKVSHHGSSTSSTEKFLNAVSPEYAVISCGKDNEYGHPHAEVVAALREADTLIFRTDKQGSIIAVSDGEEISWNVEPLSDKELESNQAKEEAKVNKTDETNEANKTNETDEVNKTNEAVVYILNTNTGKFHYPNCSSADSIAEKNKEEYFGTRKELIDSGYSPCGRCTP